MLSEQAERKKRPCLMPTCAGERFDLVHKFPMEKERAIMWLDALNIPELYSIPLEKLRNSLFICSRHFRNQDYKNIVSRHLNKTAIPSINLKCLDQMDLVLDRSCQRPQHLITEDKSRRKEIPTEIILKGSKRLLDNKTGEQISSKMNPKKISNLETSFPCKVLYANEDVLKKSTQSTSLVNCEEYKSDFIEFDLKEKISNKLGENGNKSKLSAEFESELCDNEVIEDIDQSFEKSQVIDNESAEQWEMSSNFLKLRSSKYPDILSLDNFWLRDHCRCKLCYSMDTYQRKFDLCDIPIDIKAIDIKITEDLLYVKWSDKHESEYDLKFLHQTQPNFINDNESSNHVLWDRKKALNLNDTRVTFSNFLTDDNMAKNVLRSLIQYGFAFIEKVPPTEFMTETAIKRLFPIQKTFFGEMWTFTDEKEHQDSAYAKERLNPHTDNIYFNDAAGLQVFHCITHSGEGGETILLDGFKVLNDFQKTNPEAYNRLTKTDVPGEYIENRRHHKYSAPIIKLHNITKKPEQIRFNLYDRAPLNTIPQSEMLTFYKDLRLLSAEISSDKNEWKFKLNPGTILIFDNWRILHGREKYSGQRKMTGCYISRTEFLSVSRTMGLINPFK